MFMCTAKMGESVSRCLELTDLLLLRISNQIKINIRLIRWQITTTDTDANVVYNYIDTKLLEGRRTKLSSGQLNLTTILSYVLSSEFKDLETKLLSSLAGSAKL